MESISSPVNNIDLIIRTLTYLTVTVSLIITAYQVRRNTRTNGASYWLELRKMFSDYDEIHKNLQLDATWRNEDKQVDANTIVTIVGYMGLFEHCYDMMKKGLIDRKIFKDIYSYRIHVIMDTPVIVTSTLINSGRYWENFRLLANDFGHVLPPRRDLDVRHKQVNYPVGWESALIG